LNGWCALILVQSRGVGDNDYYLSREVLLLWCCLLVVWVGYAAGLLLGDLVLRKMVLLVVQYQIGMVVIENGCRYCWGPFVVNYLTNEVGQVSLR